MEMDELEDVGAWVEEVAEEVALAPEVAADEAVADVDGDDAEAAAIVADEAEPGAVSADAEPEQPSNDADEADEAAPAEAEVEAADGDVEADPSAEATESTDEQLASSQVDNPIENATEESPVALGEPADEPDPKPRRRSGFEVIEGTGPGTAAWLDRVRALASDGGNEVESAPSEADPAAPSATPAPRPHANSLAAGGARALESVGSFLNEGMDAVRQVNEAKRAHGAARGELEALEQAIIDNQADLDHRQDVMARYTQIVEEQMARQEAADAAIRASKTVQKGLEEHIAQLKEALAKAREADQREEGELEAALKEVASREEQERKAAAELQHALDNANRGVESVEAKYKKQLEDAERAVEEAQGELNALKSEFAGLQRRKGDGVAETVDKPAAELTAGYTAQKLKENNVDNYLETYADIKRGAELQASISDAMNRLRCAEAEKRALKDESESMLATAKAKVQTAQAPIAEARRVFQAITDETDAAREALSNAKERAGERQLKAKEEIARQEQELRARKQEEEDALAEIADAQAIIDDARDIKAHPEAIQQLMGDLERDAEIRREKLGQVEALAAREREVRDSTRTSRIKFLGTVGGVLAVVLVIVILWLVLR